MELALLAVAFLIVLGYIQRALSPGECHDSNDPRVPSPPTSDSSDDSTRGSPKNSNPPPLYDEQFRSKLLESADRRLREGGYYLSDGETASKRRQEPSSQKKTRRKATLEFHCRVCEGDLTFTIIVTNRLPREINDSNDESVRALFDRLTTAYLKCGTSYHISTYLDFSEFGDEWLEIRHSLAD